MTLSAAFACRVQPLAKLNWPQTFRIPPKNHAKYKQ